MHTLLFTCFFIIDLTYHFSSNKKDTYISFKFHPLHLSRNGFRNVGLERNETRTNNLNDNPNDVSRDVNELQGARPHNSNNAMPTSSLHGQTMGHSFSSRLSQVIHISIKTKILDPGFYLFYVFNLK